MTPEMVLVYLVASIIFTVCAFAVVALFAYALAIWDTYTEKRRP